MQPIDAFVFTFNEKADEELVFVIGFFSVVSRASAAAVCCNPRLRTHKPNKISERRIDFFIPYLLRLKENAAIFWRFWSGHYSFLTCHLTSTSSQPFESYTDRAWVEVKGKNITIPWQDTQWKEVMSISVAWTILLIFVYFKHFYSLSTCNLLSGELT